MMRLSRIYILLLLVGCLCSCIKYDVEEILLDREELSLTWRGEVQISYAPMTWQTGCNIAKGEYRVYDDSMANYFVIRCKERPTVEGQDMSADIEWTVKTNIKRYEGLKFTVRRIGEDGRIWLWNKSQKIGVVIKEME